MTWNAEALAQTMQRGALRPEEVVLASSAAPVHHSVFWRYLSDDPIIRLHMDAFGAVVAGVV